MEKYLVWQSTLKRKVKFQNNLKKTLSSVFFSPKITRKNLRVLVYNTLKGEVNMSFWDKKNRNKKTNYDISKETGIPEEKVKEIMKGEREVPTDRVDTLNKALKSDNKTERSIRILNAKEWLKSTDLTSLRLSWGYVSQKEVAEAAGVAQSSYSLIESKEKPQDEFFHFLYIRI